MVKRSLSTRCCIAGGGPAGMMAGLLLARAGIEVVVLEKHGDFLRDFRGDTIHPSTLEVLRELGLLAPLLERPHVIARELEAQVGDRRFTVADFRHLPTACGFVAFMPQWDFLDLLAREAARYTGFSLQMNAEVTGLLREQGRIAGLTAETPDGTLEIGAELVIGADGRNSIVRERAGLEILDLGAPIDVLWFRLARSEHEPSQTMGRFAVGAVFIMINRGDYWQCGLVISKGGFDEVRRAGLPAFRARVAALAPDTTEVALKDWDAVKLLTVRVDRLKRWHAPGLCASATRRTPCRRSAASESTWRSRMPWRPPTCLPGPWAPDGLPSASWPPSNGAGSCRHA